VPPTAAAAAAMMAAMAYPHHALGELDAMDESVDQGFQALVIKEHISTEDLQLTLRLGDIVCVVEEDATGWAGGYKVGDEQTSGWFPRICVRTLAQQEQLQHVPLAEPAESPALQCPLDPISPGMVRRRSEIELPAGAANDALVTKAESPIRGRRSVATPNGMQARDVEGDREYAQLKEEVASLTQDLGAQRCLRERAEQELATERGQRACSEQDSSSGRALEELATERGQRARAEQELATERGQRARAEQELATERGQRALAEQELAAERGQRARAEQELAAERGQRARAEQDSNEERLHAQCEQLEARRLREHYTGLEHDLAGERMLREALEKELQAMLAGQQTSQQTMLGNYNTCKARLSMAEQQLAEVSAVLSEKSNALNSANAQRQASEEELHRLRRALESANSRPHQEGLPAASAVAQQSPVPQQASTLRLGAELPELRLANSVSQEDIREALPSPPSRQPAIAYSTSSPAMGTEFSPSPPVWTGRPTEERGLLFGSGLVPGRHDPAEAPRPGSVRAQIRMLEKRCSTSQLHRTPSRGPCPLRSESGRRSGPVHSGLPPFAREALPRASAPATPTAPSQQQAAWD